MANKNIYVMVFVCVVTAYHTMIYKTGSNLMIMQSKWQK